MKIAGVSLELPFTSPRRTELLTVKLLEPYEINEVKFSKIHPSAYKLLTLVNTVATFLTVVLNNLRFFGASVPSPVPAPKTDNLYLYFVELNPSKTELETNTLSPPIPISKLGLSAQVSPLLTISNAFLPESQNLELSIVKLP